MPNKFFENIANMTPGFLKTDILRKLIALFFAILVWYSVAHKLGKEKQISGVPVNVVLPENFISTGPIPPVTLRVNAREGVLSRLYGSDFSVRVTVKSIPDAIDDKTIYLNLHTDDVNAPAGVVVMDIQPQKVPCSVDRMISKAVKVKERFSGKLLFGYKTGKINIIPSEVTLTGPERLISKWQMVNTRPILLDDKVYENFEYDVDVESLPKGISVKPQQVKVYVEISKEMKEKEVKGVPIKILEYPGDKQLQVALLSNPHVAVSISGSKKIINSLKPEKIKAFIDLSPFKQPGTYNVQVDCWIGGEDSITIKNIAPKQVSVSIEKIIPKKEDNKK